MNHHYQRGLSLIESLIAILVFSIGMLAMIGMYAIAITAAGDAQYRSEATNYATELIQGIAANVARDADGAVQPASLASFAVNAGSGATCAWSGGTAAGAPVAITDWLARVRVAGTGLPGASATGYQRVVVGNAASFNRVAVTLCWSTPGAGSQVHRHEVVAYIN